jgi:hypothetical protein
VRDDELRELERRASQGDAEARRALENAWARLGRGWNGETLPDRLRTGFEKPFYLWDTLLGFAIEMVLVPAGEVEVTVFDLPLSLRLGAASHAGTRRERRSVARPFWIARTQVSREEYAQLKYVGTPVPDAPMISVTFKRAAEFAAWVGLDLPTEAQWDKASCETLRGQSFMGMTPEWCSDDYIEPATASISGKVLRLDVVGSGLVRNCGDARAHAAIRLVLPNGS